MHVSEHAALCRGGGAAEMFGVGSEVDIHIGTLSKGFGSHGGFVAGSSVLKSFLMNKGRSYVFSTALPLPAVAAAQAAINVCQQVHLLLTACSNTSQTQRMRLIFEKCMFGDKQGRPILCLATTIQFQQFLYFAGLGICLHVEVVDAVSRPNHSVDCALVCANLC